MADLHNVDWNGTFRNIILFIGLMGLLSLAISQFIIAFSPSKQNTLTMKIEAEGNASVTNSTMAYAQLWFECYKYCKSMGNSYCDSTCMPIIDLAKYKG